MPRMLLVLCSCALVMGAACIPPDHEDVFVRYRRDVSMGVIQDRGTLRVAIDDSWAPFSGGEEGFVGRYASYLAEVLRVDLEVDVMPTEDILPAVNRGSADLGFPLLPVTETLARRNTLTNPYWVSHQRLAVRSGGGIEDARDLDGKRACEARSEDVDVPLEVVSPDISIVVAPLPSSRCERLLASEAVDAVTGADAYLASIAADDPGVEIVGEQLSTYAFSAAAPQGDTGLSAWVEAELAEAISEGRWREWFEDTMGEVEGLGGPVAPELTLEEAATLFPKGV